MSRPILILGGSGFIGNAIYRELSPFYNTLGTYYNAKGYKNNSHFIYFNHENDNLNSILEKFNPKLIISSLRGDIYSQVEAHMYMKEHVQKHDCRIIFISSANVFDSFRHYPSYEYDKTLSKSLYGHFKIKIENQLLNLKTGKYIILRLPMIFGLNSPRTLKIDQALKDNSPIEVFPNTVINVNSDVRLSQQIHYIINHKKTGIFHLGSVDLISHYDFIRTLVERRYNKPGFFKRVFTSNTTRYLAVLPKENKLPRHIQPSYENVLSDLTLQHNEN
ncbi:MAG: sugar nucleotide-binding protein [Flavobacteriaceae bacterium]